MRTSRCLAVTFSALILIAGVAACAPTAASNAPSPAANPTQQASPASTLEDQFIAVVNKVSPSVVAIQAGSGLGSGVIFDVAGHIVTNAHVVAGASALHVFLANGDSYPATLVGTYVPDDIAVLKIAAAGLQPAVFADSDRVRVGSIVMAIGSPLGLQGSVTEGIVSAVGRQVSEPNGVALPPVIQTSASINPGNSGGALVSLDSEVVGITTLAAQDPLAGGTAPGIGFAIPSNVVKDIASQLIATGKVTDSHRAFLGVQVASGGNGGGAVVYAVSADGPASRAGLVAGDVIKSLGGHEISDQPSLASALAALTPGARVEIVVERPGAGRLTFSVTLGELPA